MRKRNWKFNVYLNTDEKSMLRKKAEATGLTTSALIRYLITNFKPKEKPPEEFYESLSSIRKIGNVLNQIAVRMHMIGYVEDEKNWIFLKTCGISKSKIMSNLNLFN